MSRLPYSIIILSILCLLMACNQIRNEVHDEPATINTTSVVKSGIKEKTDSSIHGNYFFDLDKFKMKADSFVSSITREHIKFNVLMNDTLQTPALFETEGTLFRMYELDPGKGKRLFRFYISISEYKDATDASHALKKLRESEDTKAPGLTYTNDYVLKMDNKIVWLNTGCSYAYKNHMQLKNILLSCLHFQSVKDSIVCQCGGQCW